MLRFSADFPMIVATCSECGERKPAVNLAYSEGPQPDDAEQEPICEACSDRLSEEEYNRQAGMTEEDWRLEYEALSLEA